MDDTFEKPPTPSSALESGDQAGSSNDKRIQVVADDREAKSGVIAALQEIGGVKVRVSRLSLGDYEVDARFVIERKTMLDFAASLVDGRLFSQADRLVGSGALAAMIVEGHDDELANSKMRREALHQSLVQFDEDEFR